MNVIHVQLKMLQCCTHVAVYTCCCQMQCINDNIVELKCCCIHVAMLQYNMLLPDVVYK